MADAPEITVKNRLLAMLPAPDRARIEPMLTEVPLEFREDLYRPGQPTECVWFPYSGVVSLVTELTDGEPVEIATIGPEGMVGVQQLLGADRMSSRAFVQVAGAAGRMTAADFHRIVDESPELNRLLHRYVLALFSFVAQTAACNRMHTIEERLARWLLMTNDRVHSREFSLTHEFLAQMLGVRRPTVSLAAGMLAKAGLIHYVRGHITILDRIGLEDAACECYQTIASEFQRLVGTKG